MIRFQLKIEHIQKLLQGKKILYKNYNKEEVQLLPPQEGLFMTREEFEKILDDRTNIVDRLLKMMEESDKK